ncbi:MAG: 30S ribosomal protein S18 [Candidatus Babeliales bacterium]
MTKKIKGKILARFKTKKVHRQAPSVKKECRLCFAGLKKASKIQELDVKESAGAHVILDYKDSVGLGRFLTERKKILPQRISGNCRKHQAILSLCIKRARIMALLPYK